MEEAALLRLIEKKPAVQFGINGKNLDHIYSGHKPAEYGLALRKWIYGADGLAYQMILPSKNCQVGELVLRNNQCLHFFVSFLPDIFGDFCQFFSIGSFVNVIICTCF